MRLPRHLGPLWLVALLPLAGCAEDMSFLASHGPVADEQRAHILRIALTTGIVVVPALLLGPFVAWRYRYGAGRRYTPRWDFSWWVEIALWGVPIAITVSLVLLLLHSTLKLDPYASVSTADGAEPFEVQVVGYDWKWLFLYPEHGVASVGELVWPADRPLRLALTSATVMQSFHIPQLGSQIYAMAGMRTDLNLAAEGPGVFGGQNTQYNGEGFWRQKFVARALDLADWSAWLEDARLGGLPFDDAARRALAARSTKEELARALGAHAASTAPAVAAVPAGVVRFRDVPGDVFATVLEGFGHAMPPVVALPADADAAARAALLCGPAPGDAETAL